MNDDELSPEARGLLDAALAVEPEFGPGARERTRARVFRSVAGAAIVAGSVAVAQTSVAAGGASATGAVLASGAATSTATGAAVGGAAASATVATALTKAVVGLAAIGLVGGGTAAWRTWRASPAPVAAIHAPSNESLDRPPPIPRAPSEPLSAENTLPAPQIAEVAPLLREVAPGRREAPSPAAPSSTTRSVTSPESFPEELAALERARVALGAGDWQLALREIAEADRRSSARTFAEEREALRILALCSGGRGADARRLVTSFRTTFPRSLQFGRIERACAKVVTDFDPGGHTRE